jgi:hypothetical protein
METPGQVASQVRPSKQMLVPATTPEEEALPPAARSDSPQQVAAKLRQVTAADGGGAVALSVNDDCNPHHPANRCHVYEYHLRNIVAIIRFLG